MKRIQSFLYIIYFLPVFFTIRILTGFLALIGFNKLVRFSHNLFDINHRVLYLAAFFPENAGYHYRVHKWVEILNHNGFEASTRYVFEKEQFDELMSQKRTVFFQTVFLLHRIWHCIYALTYNCVIVRRELLLYNDYGNLFLEKLLLALHPNVVLDFDDDISVAKREPREITLVGRLMFESPAKFQESLKLYSRFIVGSNYLRNLVSENKSEISDKDIVVIATCVDYKKYPIKVYDWKSEYVNFGWLGSNHNIYLLKIIIPVLNEISKNHKIRFLVISGQDYGPENANFEIVNISWSLEKELENLHKIDIGLMPLYDTAVERGKCGFKLIQYMGAGIVSIAGAITINKEIIDDKQNGFLVHRESDWLSVIEEVLARREDFPTIGAEARKKICNKFSFEANKKKYLNFIETAVNKLCVA
ncbi:MAG: glycosyltransferase [Thermodesulfobacteriota bacterium]